MVEVLKAGLVSFLLALPASVSLLLEVVQKRGGVVPVPEGRLIRETVLFRTPHHYDLGILPFLLATLIGLVAVAGLPRLLARAAPGARRYSGLLLGQGILLLTTFVCHGPYFFREEPPGPFFLYTLDLSRTTPLFLALCGTGIAAAIPRADEPLARVIPRRVADRIFSFSAMLAVACILLLNMKHDPWIDVLILLVTLGYIGRRSGWGARAMAPAIWAFAAAATVGFIRHVELRAPFNPLDQALFSWARTDTPTQSLFIVPPALEAFRLGAQRSVYVDFKLLPPTQPSLAWKARARLEEVTNPDAKALEQARGWPGLYWWDVSYAKRNPPARIARLLASTGADYFVQDRVYLELPPHLDSDEDEHPEAAGLEVAFENARYRVYQLAPLP